MKRLGIVLALLAACSPPPARPDVVELDARAEDVQAVDERPTDSAPDVADVAPADAADAAGDVPSADACEFRLLFTDNDGDGFGGGGPIMFSCTDPIPPRGSLRGGDCNDVDRNIYPGALEHCDGVDSNCDGDLDRIEPGMPRSLPRDETHLSCADVGRALNIWRFPEWSTEPRCAFRGIDSPAPYRGVSTTTCQVCRADSCLCWTDPIGGGGRSVPCPYE